MQRSTGTSSVCFTPSRLGSNEYFVKKKKAREKGRRHLDKDGDGGLNRGIGQTAEKDE